MSRHLQWAAGALAVTALAFASVVLAESAAVQVLDPWVRPMGAGPDTTSAMYALIKNPGGTGDTLLSASSPLAQAVELHAVTKAKDGMMQMRPVKGGILVPAHGEVQLKPGGYHVMLIGLKQAITAGDQVPLTLKFAKAGAVSVLAKVEQRVGGSGQSQGATPGMEGMSGHGEAAHGSGKH